jgi:hypothetical protein
MMSAVAAAFSNLGGLSEDIPLKTDEQKSKQAEYMRNWRAKNPINKEKHAEYQRRWRAANPEKAKEIMKRATAKRAPQLQTKESWARSAEARRAARKRWNEANPEKRRIHTMIELAVFQGYMEKPNECSQCGIECNPHGHHEDYSRPKEVIWLCHKCHRILHRGK